jgi:hypothetical protein
MTNSGHSNPPWNPEDTKEATISFHRLDGNGGKSVSTAASVSNLPGEAALLVVWEVRGPSDTDHWIQLWLRTDEALQSYYYAASQVTQVNRVLVGRFNYDPFSVTNFLSTISETKSG